MIKRREKKKEVKEKKRVSKRKAQEKIPQYLMSATNIKTLNYQVYYMNKVEKVLYFLAAFCIGAAVGYLFYGGIGTDEYGEPTRLTHILNILIPLVVGAIAGTLFLPIRTEQIIKKRKSKLKEQFRTMLDSLATSLGAGNNVTDAFEAAEQDMRIQYEEGAFILRELKVILDGVRNGIPIEDVLKDFGLRSGIDDILSFSEVFQVSYRSGGNIKEIIHSTHSIISEKMMIEDEIETMVTGNKTEQNIMVFMPIMLVGAIKAMSPEFAANFVTATGVVSTTLAIGCFIAAYFMSRMILDIKV